MSCLATEYGNVVSAFVVKVLLKLPVDPRNISSSKAACVQPFP